jgi:hypothetical protein
LIVIGIIGILAIVVVLVISPIEILKRSRDSSRLSDMDTMRKVLSLYQEDVTNGSLGTPNTLYLSLIDPTATSSAGTNCSGFTLAPPPAGWSFHCAAASTARHVDGTGWLPVDLTKMSIKSPRLGNLWVTGGLSAEVD